MATTRAPTKPWVAREGEVIFANADALTIDGNKNLSGIFGDAGAVTVEAAVKNISDESDKKSVRTGLNIKFPMGDNNEIGNPHAIKIGRQIRVTNI